MDLLMHTIRVPLPKPYFVTILLIGQDLPMEIDTGAAVFLISEDTKKHIFPSVALKKADVLM